MPLYILMVGFVPIFVCPVCMEKKKPKPVGSVFIVGEEMGHQIFDIIFWLHSILSEDGERRPDLGAANCLPLLPGCQLLSWQIMQLDGDQGPDKFFKYIC